MQEVYAVSEADINIKSAVKQLLQFSLYSWNMEFEQMHKVNLG